MFRISNSKLHDWESMCPIAFKAKHIDKDPKFQFEPSIEMEWGNYFETLVIGAGIGGRVFDFETSPHGKTMKTSVHRERVEEQAKACRRYLRLLGGKMKSKQEYIQAEIEDFEGVVIPIEGTLDILYAFIDAKLRVIDLKFTGDTENDFGKFAWGHPEKMDLSQIIQYSLLVKLKYELEELPESQYWVFDKDADLKQKLINVTISQGALDAHIERLSEAYNAITMAMTFNDWPHKNTFENCSKCPLNETCKFARIMPEYYEVEL